MQIRTILTVQLNKHIKSYIKYVKHVQSSFRKLLWYHCWVTVAIKEKAEAFYNEKFHGFPSHERINKRIRMKETKQLNHTDANSRRCRCRRANHQPYLQLSPSDGRLRSLVQQDIKPHVVL